MSASATPDHPVLTDSESGQDTLLPLLLEICEDFLAQASPTAHSELDVLLRCRGITGGAGWLIDMLGLTRLRLQQHNADSSPTAELSQDAARQHLARGHWRLTDPSP